MKKTTLIGWAGIVGMAGLLLTSAASCSKSAEGFCQSWVEDTCKAIAGCCKSGKTYDEDQCRIDLSKTCQGMTEVEKVHSGEVVFDSGAASDCFGDIKTCADLDAANDLSSDRQKACKNIVSGFRPAGAACGSDSDCQATGEYPYCYNGNNGSGVCADVVLDEEKCSFSFDTNELHVCPDGKYCDINSFKPSPTASPTSRAFEFSASCKPDVAAGGKCVDTDHNPLPCAKGLYCDIGTGTGDPTCKTRKAAGSACNYAGECADGLDCNNNPAGQGQTCQAVTADGPYCFSPPKCGDGACNGTETPQSCPQDCGGGGNCGDGFCDTAAGENITCPQDCGGGNSCGDGFCDVNIGESVTCPQDCCGNGNCDPGETSTCPSDCAP